MIKIFTALLPLNVGWEIHGGAARAGEGIARSHDGVFRLYDGVFRLPVHEGCFFAQPQPTTSYMERRRFLHA
jgi:hypothetical protein